MINNAYSCTECSDRALKLSINLTFAKETVVRHEKFSGTMLQQAYQGINKKVNAKLGKGKLCARVYLTVCNPGDNSS